MKKRRDFHNFIEFVIVLRPARCNTTVRYWTWPSCSFVGRPVSASIRVESSMPSIDLWSAILNLMWEASLSIGARPTVWREYQPSTRGTSKLDQGRPGRRQCVREDPVFMRCGYEASVDANISAFERGSVARDCPQHTVHTFSGIHQYLLLLLGSIKENSELVQQVLSTI